MDLLGYINETWYCFHSVSETSSCVSLLRFKFSCTRTILGIVVLRVRVFFGNHVMYFAYTFNISMHAVLGLDSQDFCSNFLQSIVSALLWQCMPGHLETCLAHFMKYFYICDSHFVNSFIIVCILFVKFLHH